MPYNYIIIKEIISNPQEIWKLEKELHRKYRDYKYIPKIYFGGIGECFSFPISIGDYSI